MGLPGIFKPGMGGKGGESVPGDCSDNVTFCETTILYVLDLGCDKAKL
jgi:hypothetical protein